jgi:hypothetical protein
MSDTIKTTKKVIEALDEVQSAILLLLLEEDRAFTGKISIEINCNQGGITGTEVFSKRKMKKVLDNQMEK